MVEKAPISEMMVGTNSGNEAYETLLEVVSGFVCAYQAFIPSEVAQSRDPTLGITNTFPDLPESQTLLVLEIESLVAACDVDGHVLLTFTEELGRADVVWKQVPSKDCKSDSWQTLDQEQDPPGRKTASNLADTVCKSTTISVGLEMLAMALTTQRRAHHSCTTDEDTLSESDLLTRIEETEV